MLHCPNKNSTLYKLLKQLNGGSEGLATHYYDEVNRLQDLGVISSKRFEAKESGKMYYSIPKIITEKSVSDNMKGKKNGVFTKDEAAFVELERQLIERDIDWIKITETPKAYRVELLPGVKTDTVGQTKMNLSKVAGNLDIISEDIIVPILEDLKARFDLDYETINDPSLDWRGKFDGEKVIINLANVTMDTPFHEFAHPFISIIRRDNKTLYDSLLSELENTPNGIAALEMVKKYYPNLSISNQEEEAIVSVIGMYASKNIDATTGQKLIDKIKEVLNAIAEFLGIKVNPSTLSKMTLKELGALMASDKKVDLSTLGNIGVKNALQKVEEEELPKNELSELTDKIKLFLNKKLAILERRNIKNKKYKENQLKRVIDTIKELEGVETINTFVEDAYSQIKLAEKQFDNLIKNKDSFSNKEMIDSLSTFNDFVSGYSILDEISEADIEEYFSNPEKGLKEQESFSVQDKLSYAIMAREKIKQRYLKQGIPLLADYLLGYKSKELTSQVKREIEQTERKIAYIQNNSSNSEEKNKQISIHEKRIAELEGFDLTKESLIKQLKSASADEGAIDFLFSPLISSEDSVIALFAKSVKDQLENSRIKSIEFAKKADKEFNDFAEKSGKSKDNVSKFNEGIYEEIEVPVGKDANGDTIFAKKLAFVQKYDVTSFEKNKSKFFKSIGPKPIITEESTKEEKAALKEWNKAVGKWFSENTQAKSVEDIKEIIKQKDEELEKGIITKEEYDQWTKRVISTYEGVDTYKYELAEPSSKYINKKYTDLEGTAQGDYYNFLLESYLNSQKRLPENFRKGYILPSIEKEDLDRASERGIVDLVKNKAKESVQRQDYDTEYGLAGLNEKDAKYLPVFFTQNMDAGQVSKDLISSIMRFDAMSLRYEALNNISGETALIKQVVSKRDTIKTNSKGEKVLDAFAKKMGYEEYIKNSGESYSEKHLTAFIDMIIYGELQKEETIFGLDAGKITNTMTGFSAITTIAADLLKGVSNNIQGNIQSMIEANSGEYFTKTDLAKGKLFYAKSVPDFLSDFNQISPKTLPSQLVELYDAMQGQFKDEYGRAVSGSVAKKLFRTNTLFFNQNIGEHEIQVSMLFSILNSEKVKNKKNGEELSVLEAYQEFGIDGLLENTDFTEEKRKDIQNNLHALNKRLNGVYNEFDKGTAQRYSLGRLAIMYRKHLIPGYKRRFKKLSADQELGGITEGYYRTFWNTFAKDLGQLKFNIANNWSSYTDFEKAQIKRTLAEAVIILMLSSAVMVLKSLGDDDDELKKNWAYNFLLYQAVRLRSETSSYISPLDAYRVVKSPSAMTSTAERAIKFTNQLLFTWDPEKLKYKKKTGVWKKGDNKSWANFLKLIGYSGYNITPEEAVKSFEMSVNK